MTYEIITQTSLNYLSLIIEQSLTLSSLIPFQEVMEYLDVDVLVNTMTEAYKAYQVCPTTEMLILVTSCM